MSHDFGFAGGDALRAIGASWFVSYAYYKEIDPNHTIWKMVKTYKDREKSYETSREYHPVWLREVLSMSDKKLNTSSLHLGSSVIKQMALDILKKTLLK